MVQFQRLPKPRRNDVHGPQGAEITKGNVGWLLQHAAHAIGHLRYGGAHVDEILQGAAGSAATIQDVDVAEAVVLCVKCKLKMSGVERVCERGRGGHGKLTGLNLNI